MSYGNKVIYLRTNYFVYTDGKYVEAKTAVYKFLYSSYPSGSTTQDKLKTIFDSNYNSTNFEFGKSYTGFIEAGGYWFGWFSFATHRTANIAVGIVYANNTYCGIYYDNGVWTVQ